MAGDDPIEVHRGRVAQEDAEAQEHPRQVRGLWSRRQGRIVVSARTRGAVGDVVGVRTRRSQ